MIDPTTGLAQLLVRWWRWTKYPPISPPIKSAAMAGPMGAPKAEIMMLMRVLKPKASSSLEEMS